MSDSKQDFVALTTFRAIAALCLVEFHAWNIVQPAWPESWLHSGFLLWTDYFFALSGFILMHVYSKTLFKNQHSLYNFFVHRFARIYPLHAFTLLILVVFELCRWLAMQKGMDFGEWRVFENSTQPKYIITNLLLIQAWGVQHMNSWNVPAWSISAEFACYLTFPIFIRYNLIARKASATLLTLLAIAGILLIQHTRHDYDVTYSLGAIRALSSFTLGCVLYQYQHSLLQSLKSIPPVLLQSIAIVGVLIAFKINATPLIYFPLWLLLIVSLTYESTWLARTLSWNPLVQLGNMSYSLYMMQFVVLLLVFTMKITMPSPFNTFIALPPFVILFALLGSTYAISIFTYRYIEKPGRSFVRKYLGSKAGTVLNSPQADLIKTG